MAKSRMRAPALALWGQSRYCEPVRRPPVMRFFLAVFSGMPILAFSGFGSKSRGWAFIRKVGWASKSALSVSNAHDSE